MYKITVTLNTIRCVKINRMIIINLKKVYIMYIQVYMVKMTMNFGIIKYNNIIG